MHHLSWCFLMALTWALTMAANESSCFCQFPNQMSGKINLWIGPIHPSNEDRRVANYNIDVDFKAQRAKFYTYRKDNPWYYLDFGNKTMYTYNGDPMGDDTPVGCSSAPLPDEYTLPSCVPSGWYVYKDALKLDGVVYDRHRYHTVLREKSYYVKQNTDPCEPYTIYDQVELPYGPITNTRTYWVIPKSFVLVNPDLLYPDTSACKKGVFPW